MCNKGWHVTIFAHLHVCCAQEVRSRYPSHDGNYRDYMSTFEALDAGEDCASDSDILLDDY